MTNVSESDMKHNVLTEVHLLETCYEVHELKTRFREFVTQNPSEKQLIREAAVRP